MGREQIWCTDGHYLDWNISDFYSMTGITMEGQNCLVKGCSARIAVRNFVRGNRQRGYIVPEMTDLPNELQAADLHERAAELIRQAAELQNRANTIRLYKVPNPDVDKTEIDAEKYLDWYQQGCDPTTAPRIPYKIPE